MSGVRAAIILRVLGALALGALATVVTALGGASLIGFPRAQHSGRIAEIPHNTPDGLLLLSEFKAFGATMLISTTASTVTQLGSQERMTARSMGETLPGWCRARVLRLEPDVPWLLRSESRGWPWRALWAEDGFDPAARSYTCRGGIAVTLRWQRLNDAAILPPGKPYRPLLPLAPIWSGFLLDTAFYGALVAGVVLAPSGLRRLFRRRRGRCPRCGYDARNLPEGAPCPECGPESS